MSVASSLLGLAIRVRLFSVAGLPTNVRLFTEALRLGEATRVFSVATLAIVDKLG